jgi:hypothetical protein
MNRDHQFEKRLQRQPLREIPSAWREEILSEAKRAVAVSRPSPAPRHSSFWREFFWPCPQAWAGLAAIWLMILGVGYFTREETTIASREPSPPSSQVRELLKQQEQLLAELIGPMQTPEADRPKSLAPQPRSQCRREFLNA